MATYGWWPRYRWLSWRICTLHPNIATGDRGSAEGGSTCMLDCMHRLRLNCFLRLTCPFGLSVQGITRNSAAWLAVRQQYYVLVGTYIVPAGKRLVHTHTHTPSSVRTPTSISCLAPIGPRLGRPLRQMILLAMYYHLPS